MKLLTRTSRYYMVISVILFLCGGAIFYQLLQNILYSQVDETLVEERLLIEEFISDADSIPDFRAVFGHRIEVSILDTPRKKTERIHDTTMYDSRSGDFESFRHLHKGNTTPNGKGYTVDLYKPLKETEILTAEILVAVTALFVVLLILLIVVNYVISRRAWIPFYRTLQNLGHYDINQETPLVLTKSDIHEFILLNETLEKMSKKIRGDYLNLKEFNENAAHELQTPLAVVKSKLDLLIQDERLTEEHLQLISSVYEAINRMSKLNQGLLMISKIENRQFSDEERVDIGQIISKNLAHFEEIISMRGITVTSKMEEPVILSMNRILAEVMISNLLSNAIRHNLPSGKIEISIAGKNLVISNTGPVITTDPELLFGRFRKSDHSSDTAGLGLAIVRRITELYGFRISYTFREGFHILELFF